MTTFKAAPDVSSVAAVITEAADPGGFTAIASSGSLDRDGEVVAPRALEPLPASVPVHADHSFSVSTIVGRGVPYYEGDQLMIDVNLGSTKDAQEVRQKIRDGLVDSLSIVFTGLEWKNVEGVRTCVRGELLTADLVTVPSNRDARILTSRGLRTSTNDMRAAIRTEVLLAQVALELAEAKSFLAEVQTHAIEAVPPTDTGAVVRRFLRDL